MVFGSSSDTSSEGEYSSARYGSSVYGREKAGSNLSNRAAKYAPVGEAPNDKASDSKAATRYAMLVAKEGTVQTTFSKNKPGEEGLNELEYLERYGWSAVESPDFYLNSATKEGHPRITFVSAIKQFLDEFVTVVCIRILLGFLSLVPSQATYDLIQALSIAFVNYLAMRIKPNVNGWSTFTLLGYTMTALQKLGRTCTKRGERCNDVCEKIGLHFFLMFITLGAQFSAAITASYIIVSIADDDSILSGLGSDTDDTGVWVGLRTFVVTLTWLILYTIHGVALAHKKDADKRVACAASIVTAVMQNSRHKTPKSSSEAHALAIKAIGDACIAAETTAMQADTDYWRNMAFFIFAEELYFGPRLGFGFEIFIPLSIAIATRTDYVARIYTIAWLLGVLLALVAYAALYLPVKAAALKYGRQASAPPPLDAGKTSSQTPGRNDSNFSNIGAVQRSTSLSQVQVAVAQPQMRTPYRMQ